MILYNSNPYFAVFHALIINISMNTISIPTGVGSVDSPY